MIDGLALGENKLGTLIAVVAFVGFIGGCRQAHFEPRHVFWLSRAVAARFLRRIWCALRSHRVGRCAFPFQVPVHLDSCRWRLKFVGRCH